MLAVCICRYVPPTTVRDLDSGRYVPFEHADMLWQPMLVRDLDANILLPFSPDAGKSSNSQDLLNPPPLQVRVRVSAGLG